jgi:hypothetical protein
MMQASWKLEELDPGDRLDRRVRRRMRAAAREAPLRAAPFLPFERAIYVVVLAVYSLYAGVRAVRVFQEARAPQVLARASGASSSFTLPRGRSALPCERSSSSERPHRWRT